MLAEHVSPVPNRSSNARDKDVHQLLSLPAEPILPVLQTVSINYKQAVDYRTHCLANQSAGLSKTMSSYMYAMAKNFKSQMKVHIFDPSDPISIIGILATFELACNTKNIQEGAARWLLPSFVNNALATKHNGRMPAAAHVRLL